MVIDVLDTGWSLAQTRPNHGSRQNAIFLHSGSIFVLGINGSSMYGIGLCGLDICMKRRVVQLWRRGFRRRCLVATRFIPRGSKPTKVQNNNNNRVNICRNTGNITYSFRSRLTRSSKNKASSLTALLNSSRDGTQYLVFVLLLSSTANASEIFECTLVHADSCFWFYIL